MQLLIMKQDKGIHRKGDIVEVRATSTPFGGKEPDSFVLVEVVDAPMADFEQYNSKWERIIDYEVVNQDLAIDGFRIRLFSTLMDSAGLGSITREDVEQYIQSWNGSVHSFGTNEVVFDILIFDAMKSTAFWEIPVDEIVFAEQSYDQGTGVHRIEIDYSARANNPSYVEVYLAKEKGLFVISHADRIITVDIPRSAVRREFEEDIKKKARKLVARRRYYVGSGVVDYVIGQGGFVRTDLATVQSYIRDKVAD